jgi:dihydrofolate reductase
MARLIMFNFISLDGFYAGPDDNIDWHRTDEEFEEFAAGQLESAGALLFGRRTYEGMAGYWSTATDDPRIAAYMNSIPKAVASTTLTSADWQNTTLLKGDTTAALQSWREGFPGDVYLFGSGVFGHWLTAQGLIDEYRLVLSPVVLGAGLPLFAPGSQLALKSTAMRLFANGNVLLTYVPA